MNNLLKLHCQNLFPSHRLQQMPDGFTLIPQYHENTWISFQHDEDSKKWKFELETSYGRFFYSLPEGWKDSHQQNVCSSSSVAARVEMLANLLADSPTSQAPADSAKV